MAKYEWGSLQVKGQPMRVETKQHSARNSARQWGKRHGAVFRSRTVKSTGAVEIWRVA